MVAPGTMIGAIEVFKRLPGVDKIFVTGGYDAGIVKDRAERRASALWR